MNKEKIEKTAYLILISTMIGIISLLVIYRISDVAYEHERSQRIQELNVILEEINAP